MREGSPFLAGKQQVRSHVLLPTFNLILLQYKAARWLGCTVQYETIQMTADNNTMYNTMYCIVHCIQSSCISAV